MMNKIKSLVSLVSVAALTAPGLVLAQFQNPSDTNLPSASVTSIVQNFMKWILMIVGILGVIGFAIAGILYLTAAGDEERVKTAKNAMIMSIVGVIVALLGMVVLNAVQRFLSAGSSF